MPWEAVRTALRGIAATCRALIADRRGASAIEYGIIAGFLSIAIATTVYEVGSEVANFFSSVKNSF